MPVQLQKWHQCDLARPGWLFIDKQNYHCMVAAIELEKYAIGHEMSNQESRPKTRHLPVFPNTKLDCLGKLQQVSTYNFAASLFCTAPPLFRILLDHGSCPKVRDSCAAGCGCKDLGSKVPNDHHSLEEHSWHLASLQLQTVAPLLRLLGKTRMASSPLWTSKSTTAWWLGIELEKYAIGDSCFLSQWHQIKMIKTLKTRHLPSSNIFQHKAGSPWNSNRCLPTTSQLHFFALHNLYVGPF